MKKILSILTAILMIAVMAFALSGCKPIPADQTMTKYVDKIAESVENGYKDFDIVITKADSTGAIIHESTYIFYDNDNIAYMSDDDNATAGVDYQKLIRFADDVYSVYVIELGQTNTTDTTITAEEFEALKSNIYLELFLNMLPENEAAIVEAVRKVDLGGMSNMEIIYKIKVSADQTDSALMKINSITDKIHYITILSGEGEEEIVTTIKYNYPKLGNNVFSKDVPTIEQMIDNAKIPTEDPGEEPSDPVVDPAEPGNDDPIDPVEPGTEDPIDEPTDPVNPDDPIDPAEPGNEDPIEPGNDDPIDEPTDPAEPENPTEPEIPAGLYNCAEHIHVVGQLENGDWYALEVPNGNITDSEPIDIDENIQYFLDNGTIVWNAGVAPVNIGDVKLAIFNCKACDSMIIFKLRKVA